MRYMLPVEITIPEGKIAEPEHIYAALEAALQAASENPAAFLQRLEKIESSDASWELVDGETGAPLEGRPESGLDPANMPAPAGAVWCRQDLINGKPVLADLHSDDRMIESTLDIRPFLQDVSVGDIEELHAESWSYAEAADRIAYDLEGKGDPSATRLFNYLGLNPTMGMGEQVGFGVSVEGSEALAWLRENRAELYEELPEYIKEDIGFEL